MTQFRYTTVKSVFTTNLSHQLSQIGFHFPNLRRSLDLITFSNSSNKINATGKEQQVFSFRDSRTLFFSLLLLLRFFIITCPLARPPACEVMMQFSWRQIVVAVLFSFDAAGGECWHWPPRAAMKSVSEGRGDASITQSCVPATGVH